MQLVTKLKCIIKTWSSSLFNTDRRHTMAIFLESMRMEVSPPAWTEVRSSYHRSHHLHPDLLELCLN